MRNLFILTKDFGSFKRGTIVQKGSDITDEGIEFFDVSTEIETGECYSMYNIPLELLVEASEEICTIVNNHFKFDE